MKKLLMIMLALTLLAACNNKKNEHSDMTPDEVIAILDTKILKNDKDHSLYYQRAKMLMEVGRVNDAISDLVKAISIKNDKIEYHLLLADAYFANGNVDDSYKTLDKALELDADNQEAILKQGEIAYYSRDYDRALTNLSKVTEKDPQNRTALFLKSFIYKEKGDTANAIVLLRKVCDIYPDYSPAFEELGVIYSMHHSPLAEQYLTTAINLDVNNTNARYNLAMYYQEIGQIEAAEETYKQLLDIDNTNKYAWHNRGYIELFNNSNYDKAIEHFNRALQCDSLFIEALTNRGCAYEMKGDIQNAYQDYTNALQHQPYFEPALEGLNRIK